MIRLGLVVVIAATLSSVAWSADDRRSYGLDDPLTGEDPSCNFVNRAYERTASGNFAVREYGLEPSGSYALIDTNIYMARDAFDRQGYGRWHIRRRVARETVDGIGAINRNCRLVTVLARARGPVRVYHLDWARNGYNAKAEMVISAYTSKIIKVTRHFRESSPTDYFTMIDFFETNRERVKAPATAIDLRNE